jgi:DNA-binding IscR family transcriptional regulator
VAGGWELVSRPSAITLARVYQLMRPGPVFAMHSKQPDPRCPVGKGVQRGLRGHYRNAQAALESQLGQVTVADLLRDVLAAGR